MKKTYLNNLKWITVVLVVIYHIIYMYNGVEVFGVVGPFKEIQYQDVFMYVVYPWFMLLLFVISGMCARYDLVKHSDKEFIQKRTRKYLVPSTVGLLVVGWILGYYNMQLGNAFENLASVPKPFLYIIMSVSGCGPLWYIQLLWLFSILLVLVRKIEKDKLYALTSKCPAIIIVAFFIVIFGAAQILNTPIVTVYRFGIYGVGFFFGYFVLSHDEVVDRIEKWWVVLTLLALVSGIAFIIMYWQQPYAEAVVLKTIMCNLYAWFATIALIAIMSKFGNFENKFTDFMNKKAWGMYLFHYLPIAAIAFYLSKTNTSAIVCYLLCTIGAFVGSIIIYEILSRIPFIKWAACGIGGKKQ